MRVDEIVNNKPKKVRKGYQAFELDNSSREKLREVFPPKFPEFIGHHITYRMGVPETLELPEATSFVVVGYACDDNGLECLVVEVDGTTTRLDGKTYHITWSLDRSAGFKPVSSNEVIARNGYTRLDRTINISATAKFF